MTSFEMMTLLGAPAGGSSMISTVLMVVLFVAVFYFFILRPNRKQQDQRKEMMNGIHVGDHVVTIGGLHAVVDTMDSDKKTVTLDADGIYLVFDLQAIHHVETPAAKAPAADAATVTEAPASAEATSEATSAASVADSEATSAESAAESK
ncbi:preprotein translocase subunit YajC [Furfurilactobacillus siliginis]|uniref:Preprotein translocase subunit YajC n=1 Tax=Furfurilactobacillus siliginis TaxID=348151 RepID=A0A510VMR0_9LACO|nr:preprotein translocase subunit YajC [Furfurilactobacillus siliginis]GEK28224.1 hypothetical protein LSI01_05350 [Furfurilactobacillus siliginis]